MPDDPTPDGPIIVPAPRWSDVYPNPTQRAAGWTCTVSIEETALPADARPLRRPPAQVFAPLRRPPAQVFAAEAGNAEQPPAAWYDARDQYRSRAEAAEKDKAETYQQVHRAVVATLQRYGVVPEGFDPAGHPTEQVVRTCLQAIERRVEAAERRRAEEKARRREIADWNVDAAEEIETLSGQLAEAREQLKSSSRGVLAIAAERRRQIKVEGWTLEHDDEWTAGCLTRAAICYSQRAAWQLRMEELSGKPEPAGTDLPPTNWPWDREWWKPKDATRNLVRAGALIAAELDKIARLPSAPAAPEAQQEGRGRAEYEPN